MGSDLYPLHWEGLVYVLHPAIWATETEVRIQPAVMVEIQDLTPPCVTPVCRLVGWAERTGGASRERASEHARGSARFREQDAGSGARAV